jgi:hypothetical protein
VKNIHSFVTKRRNYATRNYKLIPVIILTTLLLSVGVSLAGTLDPPAGAIDSNTGEPKSTMKSLDSIPSSWDRRLDSTNGDL